MSCLNKHKSGMSHMKGCVHSIEKRGRITEFLLLPCRCRRTEWHFLQDPRPAPLYLPPAACCPQIWTVQFFAWPHTSVGTSACSAPSHVSSSPHMSGCLPVCLFPWGLTIVPLTNGIVAFCLILNIFLEKNNPLCSRSIYF